MQPASANALLKTLEEPTLDTTFILLTNHPQEILPTILSRCVVLSFQPLTQGAIEKLLLEKGLQAHFAKWAHGSALKKAVESVARGHASPRAFYVDKLAEGIATIGAAFWPKPVIVRLSDFKSNEYKKLIGGSRYEPEEENPMLGFRGASRYISETFGEAFAMECEALLRVRRDMGLTNVEVMVPFVRTLEQARRVVAMLAERGLRRAADGGDDGLKVIMMCEVPSNAILAEQFLEHFDGMSIGSNDLTQLTLGLDRDSGLELLARDFDERDPAVKSLISRAIAACRGAGKYVGICGQGPSDHPDFADWLADEGIASISLNPDSVVRTWQRLAAR